MSLNEFKVRFRVSAQQVGAIAFIIVISVPSNDPLFTAGLLKVWSMDHPHQHQLRVCLQCKFSRSTWTYVIRIVEVEPRNNLSSLPHDSDANSSLISNLHYNISSIKFLISPFTRPKIKKKQLSIIIVATHDKITIYIKNIHS